MDTQLSNLPLPTLRKMLRDTECSAGPDAQGAVILRRIIARREQEEKGIFREETRHEA